MATALDYLNQRGANIQGMSKAPTNYLDVLNKKVTQPQFATKIEGGNYVFKDGTTGAKPMFTKYTPPVENKISEIVKKVPQLNFGPGVSQAGVTNVNEYNPVTKKTESIFKHEPKQEKPGIFDKVTSAIIPTTNAMSEEELFNGINQGTYDDTINQLSKEGYSIEEITQALRDELVTTQITTPKEKSQENLPGFDLGVKVSQGISELGKNLKFEAGNELINSKNPFVSSFGNMLEGFKFAGNIPGDTIQLAGDLGQAISNPIGTAKSVKTLAEATIETGLNKVFGTDVYTSEDKRQMIEGVNKALKENFGSLDKIQKTIIENPTDVLLTIQGGLNTAKLGIKNPNTIAKIDQINEAISPINMLKTEVGAVKGAIKGVGKGTGELGAQILGKTTGTSGETIKQALKQGGTKEFQSALKGETTPQDILGGVKQGLEDIKQNRNILYGEDYSKLEKVTTKLKLNKGEKSILQNTINSLENEYNIKPIYKEGGIIDLDFSQSKITDTASQNNIKNIIGDLNNWKDTTPKGMDILKQRVQDYYRGTPESGKADRISTMVSNKIKDKIIEQVPEYKQMVGNYEKVTNDLRDITKTLSLGKDIQTQTALTKLNSILRDNFTARQDVVKLIEQYTGKNIQAQVAGASLNPMLAKGLAGVITGGGVVFGQLTNPAFITGLATASPRLIGEIAKTVGVTTNKMNEFITNVRKYVIPNTNVNMSSLEGSSKAKILTPLFSKENK